MKNYKQFVSEEMFNRSAFYLPRNQMPQINNIADFKQFLDRSGVEYKDYYAPTVDLIPTQSDFDEEKVKNFPSHSDSHIDPIVIVRTPSGKKFILDGHHRYVAMKYLGLDIPVVETEMEVTDMLRLMYAYDHLNKTTDDGTDPL